MTTDPKPTTPAAELRSAAEKIRAAVGKAISGPWELDGPWWHDNPLTCSGMVSAGDKRRAVVLAAPNNPRSETTLEHIALWDPTVVVAAATLLDAVAHDMEITEGNSSIGMAGAAWSEALDLARLISRNPS